MNLDLTIAKKKNGKLEIKYRKPERIDPDCLPDGNYLQFLLPCHGKPGQKGVFEFDATNSIALEDFLDQYIFERKEAFVFLKAFFHALSECALNTPAVLDGRAVFIEPAASAFYFCALPVQLDALMERTPDLRDLLSWLLRHIQTNEGYEIRGFLWTLCESKTLSLETLEEQVEQAWQIYAPRTLFIKKGLPDCFTPRHSIEAAMYRFDEEESGPMNILLEEEIQGWKNGQPSSREENTPVPQLEQTMILNPQDAGQNPAGWLEILQEQFPLAFESIVIGRQAACDIVISNPDISARHAKITVSQNRCYIQDLKSLNGTWIGDKAVIRRMRLRDGMHIRFGSVEAVFHE